MPTLHTDHTTVRAVVQSDVPPRCTHTYLKRYTRQRRTARVESVGARRRYRLATDDLRRQSRHRLIRATPDRPLHIARPQLSVPSLPFGLDPPVPLPGQRAVRTPFVCSHSLDPPPLKNNHDGLCFVPPERRARARPACALCECPYRYASLSGHSSPSLCLCALAWYHPSMWG
jgi:hypothetical protein